MFYFTSLSWFTAGSLNVANRTDVYTYVFVKSNKWVYVYVKFSSYNIDGLGKWFWCLSKNHSTTHKDMPTHAFKRRCHLFCSIPLNNSSINPWNFCLLKTETKTTSFKYVFQFITFSLDKKDSLHSCFIRIRSNWRQIFVFIIVNML